MIRRFLLLIAISIAFGGFTFYAAVVVPVGTRVLDATSQGFVTSQVTQVLNIAWGLAVLMMVWEMIAGCRIRSRRSNIAMVVLTLAVGLCTLALFVLHPRLDALLDRHLFAVTEPLAFYRLHQVYLWISTIQWLGMLGWIWCLAATGIKAERLVGETCSARSVPLP